MYSFTLMSTSCCIIKRLDIIKQYLLFYIIFNPSKLTDKIHISPLTEALFMIITLELLREAGLECRDRLVKL